MKADIRGFNSTAKERKERKTFGSLIYPQPGLIKHAKRAKRYGRVATRGQPFSQTIVEICSRDWPVRLS